MRNRGLASACGAALILECLERGLYPSWDAHTEDVYKRQLVEFHKCEDGISLHGHRGQYSVYPVEYKKGKPKLTEEDRLQLAAQAMCLEEMFSTEIPAGAVFYGETRRRETVVFTEELRLSLIHIFYGKGTVPSDSTDWRRKNDLVAGIRPASCCKARDGPCLLYTS